MSNSPTGAASAADTTESVFEQPLTERLRIFLRLDFLYSQAIYHNENGSAFGSRAAVASLLDIIAITMRGDVRSEVLKELERNASYLTEFQNRPGIDASRLRTVIANLTRLRGELANTGTGWLQTLRESEFLAAIKHRIAIPGGTCEFDLPDYSFWLSQPDSARMATFASWLGLLRPLCDAIAELLWLLRQNGRPRSEIARAGLFNVNFERDTPYQMLRVLLPAGSPLYPEVSGSHYRCSMRFLEWRGIDQRSKQTDDDVPFTLVCCA
jgi:cell division protein ZapD